MQGVHRAAKVESIDGREFFLVEVIAVTLKYLKEKLIDELKQRGHTDIKSSNFRWVITVPAILAVRGKQVMREAAYLVSKYIIIYICLPEQHGCMYTIIV